MSVAELSDCAKNVAIAAISKNNPLKMKNKKIPWLDLGRTWQNTTTQRRNVARTWGKKSSWFAQRSIPRRGRGLRKRRASFQAWMPLLSWGTKDLLSALSTNTITNLWHNVRISTIYLCTKYVIPFIPETLMIFWHIVEQKKHQQQHSQEDTVWKLFSAMAWTVFNVLKIDIFFDHDF